MDGKLDRLELDVAKLKGDMNAMEARLTASPGGWTDMAELRTDLSRRETWFLGTVITGFVALGAAIAIIGLRDGPTPSPRSRPS